jgi:two-component system response regulator YesN
MFTLLIVDDEQVERHGVKYLVNDLNLNLIICEAENGKKALEIIRSNHVDILFTDIKMPFMNGLDLICEAKKINPKLKVVVFSAYGEFEYAKKSMESGAMYYLLKPVDPNEFLYIMSKVIKNCSDEKDEEGKMTKLIEGYNKNLIYEKDKLLTDLINGTEIEEDLLKQFYKAGINLQCVNSVMLLVDMRESFYGSKNDEFIKILQREICNEFEYLNLNENQSIIFLKSPNIQIDRQLLKDIGEKIKQTICENFGIKSCLIFSDTIKGVSDYNKEFKNIEKMTDFGFFFDDSIILFTNDNFSDNIRSTEWIDKILENIYAAFDSGDSLYAVKGIEQLFDMFKSDKSLSSLYVMYYSAEILKMANKKLAKNDNGSFKSSLEKIFSEANLKKLKDFIVSTIIDLGMDKQKNSDEVRKKVINNIIRIIEEEYFNSPGLEYIAEKVYLSPTYVSYLFKKETGVSFLKYITEYRLNKAKELLQGTNMKIVDICGKVGYSKLSYFCMIFKNNYGLTPSKYREERR